MVTRVCCRRSFARVLLASFAIYMFTLASVVLFTQQQDNQQHHDQQQLQQQGQQGGAQLAFIQQQQQQHQQDNQQHDVAKVDNNQQQQQAGEGEGRPNPGQGQGQDEQRTTYKIAGCGEALSRPALPAAPANHWLTALPQSTYVYSAYLDRRDEPQASIIRIIAISSEGIHKSHHCLLWYPDQAEPVVQPAQYEGIPEGHSKRYAGCLFNCNVKPVDSGQLPVAVSLTTDHCQQVSNIMALTPITKPPVNAPVKHNFTVCVTPLNFHYDDVYQLVEMIEINRMFGANHFIFYNYSAGPNVTDYLRRYSDDGIVTVLTWDLPVAVETWPPTPDLTPEIHYFGQLASLNDCLYRAMSSSRFTVFTDLDEHIVPMGHGMTTWQQMLQEVDSSRNDPAEAAAPGAYLFRNTFFRVDLPDNPAMAAEPLVAALQLRSLLKITREKFISPHFQRSKYMVRSAGVDLVGVHVTYRIHRCDGPSCSLNVPEQLGMVYHYRAWPGGNPDVVDVNTMVQYKEEIVSRTLARHQLHRPVSVSPGQVPAALPAAAVVV